MKIVPYIQKQIALIIMKMEYILIIIILDYFVKGGILSEVTGE